MDTERNTTKVYSNTKANGLKVSAMVWVVSSMIMVLYAIMAYGNVEIATASEKNTRIKAISHTMGHG
jgi:hypothetical protein